MLKKEKSEKKKVEKENDLPVSLDFSVFERFGSSTAPNAEVVIGDHGMKVHCHVHVLEVSFLGSVSELPVIPIENADTVGLSFAQVIGQIVSYPGPEQRRDSSNWWQVILVNVVQHFVVQRDQIFELGL